MLREDDRFLPIIDSRPGDAPWPPLSWPPDPGIALTGAAVRLTQVEPDRDAPALFAALDHDTVWRHVAGRPSTSAEFADVLSERAAAGMFFWLVRLTQPVNGLEAGAVAGLTSYLDVSPRDARLEIGFTSYTPAVWATAVNPDTKLLLLGYAFDELRAGRVQLKTDVRNVRSQQAIARLGARYEGTFRRYQRRADGTIRDSVFFSIIAEEWPSVRERLQSRLEPTS